MVEMGLITVILATISVMILLEGLALWLFASKAQKLFKKFAKDKKEIAKLGLIEVIIALIIILVISM